MNDSIFLILLLFFIIKYYDKSNNDIYKLKKIYKTKLFNFKTLNYKYYNLFTRIQIIPRSSSSFISLLDKFKITNKDVFLDIGCGDGYNLLYINYFYKFKKIIGIEIDNNIFEICKYNINLINSNKIDIHNIDAIKYKISGDVNFIYLYNPFAKDYSQNNIDIKELNHYKKLILNIIFSYNNKKRKINIIFVNIIPINDKRKEILKLFISNFNLLEFGKIKLNIFQNVTYAIFQLH